MEKYDRERGQIIKFFNVAEDFLKFFKGVNTDRMPVTNTIIDYYVLKAGGQGLMVEKFVDLIKGENIQTNIEFIKRMYFIAGIMAMIENPKLKDTIGFLDEVIERGENTKQDLLKEIEKKKRIEQGV